MFFHISNINQANFPFNYQHNNLVINLDNGWIKSSDEHNNVLFYKGYLDQGKIENFISEIANQEEPLYTGNFCLIKCFDQGVTVKTDRYRSFPIYFGEDGLTNLQSSGETIHTDSFVMLTNNMQKIESKFILLTDNTYCNIEFEDCVNKVDDIIIRKLSTFFNNYKLPLNIFLSGGIDTTTLYSYVLKLDIPHTLIDYFHTDFNYFYLKNHHTLSNYWGFGQIHHWNAPCILMSGAPGDEFTARSPTTANMLLRYYNTGIDELLEDKKNSLHHAYFSRYVNLFRSQAHLVFDNLSHVIKECSNMILNDYQHWHLGHTMVYTPFRDIEIFEIVASLDKQNLIDQVFDSTVQKELIKRNAPHLLDTLSTNKNTGNFLENLTNIYTEPLLDNIS
jgi:hypothetical protein